MDNCQTPAYALDPLLPYLDKQAMYWESAAGEGYLVSALRNAGHRVVEGELSKGSDFFQVTTAPGRQITNPPFGLKYKWLKHSYELGAAFALLLPVETLGSKTAQAMFEEYGVQVLLLDSRVNFKMPLKGWGGAAQFPVCWITHNIGLPESICYGHIDRERVKSWADDYRIMGPVVNV